MVVNMVDKNHRLMREQIDYNTLEKTRLVRESTYRTKKLPEGVYACPFCYGSGRVTTVYRDPGPNRTGQCYTCGGTGEIKKCKHPDCNEPIPADDAWTPYGLCMNHEKEYLKELIHKDTGIKT